MHNFDPRRNWEAAPPGYSVCVGAWRWFTPRHRATPAWTYCGSPERLKTVVVLAGVASCGRSWRWGYGEGSRLGFKLKVEGHEGRGTRDDAGQ